MILRRLSSSALCLFMAVATLLAILMTPTTTLLTRVGRYSRLRDEALDFGNWRPVDYAVGPAVFGGYLYVRGWEKRFNAFGLRWNFGIEPVRRILERFEGSHNDLASAASLEIGMGDFPVKVIVSGGIQDGEALVDFIGIGTSVGKVKQLIVQEFAGE